MELSTLSTSSNVMSGDGTTFDARLLDRLVVSIENLFTKQTEQEIEVRGPPVSKAFDQEGNPTKVVGVFSRKYAVPLDLVYRKVDGKTEYVYARIKESSRHAMEVLSEDLPATIAKFHFRRQCVGIHRKFDEALRYFGMMRRYGFEPDSVTITTAISSSALVDMYGKYGHLEMAIKVFDQMPKKSVFAWNSMIAGYGFKGKLLEALGLFSEMRQSSVEPDAIPFTSVLAACLQLAAIPYPFAVADAAYGLMINDGINQSILLIHKNPARNQLSACLNKAMHQDRGRSSYSGSKEIAKK
ncbi:hypothetical protein KIW84_074638 [Lathyrus oleraceus]|uniref:Pentatricopeptide repeat-containing protein n=1 Tax=Pisum sativum TaxID=3888 RepID=A0A9D4VSU1_PEA|nr:hypothetical protein KIW84_074638 [Pisum sativum]